MEKMTIRRSRPVCAALLLALSAGALVPDTARPQAVVGKPWVGTWGTGLAPANNDIFFAASAYNGTNAFNNQTIREIVHTSVGGKQLRLRLSNAFGTAPLTIGAARVAFSNMDGSIITGSDHVVTFNGGGTSTTLPVGAPYLSDPVQMDVPANATLAVSLYLPDAVTVVTGHSVSLQDNFVAPPDSGDTTGEVVLPLDAAFPTIRYWPLLAGVEVRAKNARTFVAFGSSITDGFLSTPNANHRWTDYLSQRLARRGLPVGVINASVIANALLANANGGPALARFDRDVLAQPGVAYVFINDIVGVEMQAGTTLDDKDRAEEIIGGLRQFVARAHSRGIKAYAGTIIPLTGGRGGTASYEAKRQIVNAYIRGGGGFDGYADFDAAVRDPADPTRIVADYDGGDHHHLNDAGYKKLADTFDLNLFR